MRFSPLTERMTGDGYEAWAVHELAVQRRARGDDIIVLSIGDPDFSTPGPIADAAVTSIYGGRTHYSDPGGQPAVRRAIAAYYSRYAGRKVNEREIVFFPGTQNALFAVCLCVLGPGDEVLVPEPRYISYRGVTGAAGATLVDVPLRPDRHFHLQAADLQERVTPRTRAVLLNNPHNPTGASLTRREVEEIAEVCLRHDLWLIVDEVYAALNYSHSHVSPLAIAELNDRVAVVSSLSKSHAMTGWRAGWAVATPPLTDHLLNLALYMLDGSPPFIEDAAQMAVSRDFPQVKSMMATYQRRAAILTQGLAGIDGIECHPPEAGIFTLVDIRGTGLSGLEFAHGLLEQEGVSVLPGEGFGPSGAGHVRASLAVGEEHLREAARRIRRFVARVREQPVSTEPDQPAAPATPEEVRAQS